MSWAEEAHERFKKANAESIKRFREGDPEPLTWSSNPIDRKNELKLRQGLVDRGLQNSSYGQQSLSSLQNALGSTFPFWYYQNTTYQQPEYSGVLYDS